MDMNGISKARLEDSIKTLKGRLNQIIDNSNKILHTDEVLLISRELDSLVVKYMEKYKGRGIF
ncbi:MAG: aspartyl-phosphate phosphatase Spo0E family protein [Clostridia bacterium]|jgi:hypothetical protein